MFVTGVVGATAAHETDGKSFYRVLGEHTASLRALASCYPPDWHASDSIAWRYRQACVQRDMRRHLRPRSVARTGPGVAQGPLSPAPVRLYAGTEAENQWHDISGLLPDFYNYSDSTRVRHKYYYSYQCLPESWSCLSCMEI